MKPAFERDSHPFHMWDGINSIPDTLRNVLNDNNEVIEAGAKASYEKNFVRLLGCGTSYFSGIAATYFFHEATKINTSAHQAWEFAAYPVPNMDDSLLIAISHTGGTPVVLDSLQHANNKDVVTFGLTDVKESPVAKESQFALIDKSGREPAIPKTRSYIASLLKHYLLATEIGKNKGIDTSKLRAALEESPEVASEILTNNLTFTKELANTLKDVPRIFIFGGGPNHATALEGTLKLQETVHIPTNGWELEEGMHGPWVSMNEDDLVIVLAAKGPSLDKTNKFVSSIKEIGTKVWLITNDESGNPDADYVTYIPSDIPEIITPMYSILPIYQFTYHLALSRGIIPDIMRLEDESYLKTRLTLPR
jgi:glutamine---fructose-6-phosphate transaminase (isomerizing)